MSKVVKFPTVAHQASEVSVVFPQAFEEMLQVIQSLRNRKVVLLNLSLMAPMLAQRAVDFVAGGTYSLQGEVTQIGPELFLFTPSCVQTRMAGS